MTEQEFIKRVLHKPWVNRACDFDGMDCWGLVVLYYRHVLGIELPEVSGYSAGEDFECLYNEHIYSDWEDVSHAAEAGLMVTIYHGPEPSHVGILTSDKRVLHCGGSIFAGGRVSIHSIAALEYATGPITFHRFKACQR